MVGSQTSTAGPWTSALVAQGILADQVARGCQVHQGFLEARLEQEPAQMVASWTSALVAQGILADQVARGSQVHQGFLEARLEQVRAQAQVQALAQGQGWVLARAQAKAQAQGRALAQAWARAPVQALAQVQALARGRAEAKVQELARALGRVQAQRAQIRSIPTIRNLRHFQTPHRRTLLCRTHCHTNSIYHLHSHH